MGIPNVNPYTHLGRPVRHSKGFHGRKSVLSKMTNDIRNGQCVSVVGIRRIGKTSLLFQMLDKEARAAYYLNDDLICVYMTCQSIAHYAPGSIYAYILHKVVRQLRVCNRQVLPQISGDNVSYRAFENNILTIQDADLRLVLLIDDFELLAQNPNLGIDFFLGLRALHTEYDLTYVIASLTPIMELAFNQAEVLSSPFPNIFDSIRLGLFSESEARDFIQVAGVFSDETEDFLFNLTGGHPLALQYACNFAFLSQREKGNSLARRDHFGIVSQTEKAMAGHYRNYWQHLTSEQKRVLAAPVYFATQARQNTPVENLFKDLVTKGLLIRHQDGRCDYAGQLLADFVRSEMSRDLSLRASLTDNLVGETLGKYQIVQRLGRGGMGDVYKAYDSNLARDVVVKVMLPHLASDENFGVRFRREAQAIASLRHPNIVQIYDFGQQNAIHYMVMEYIAGQDLNRRLQALRVRIEFMPLSEVLHIIEQIGSALDYAHDMGILHRDIKPSNVMLLADNQAILTDFGLAKIAAGTQTTTSTLIGTPAYMAPEQADGSQPIDRRVDIYALGVLLYEMLAGQVPFKADNPVAVLYKHLQAPMPDPRTYRRDIPESLVAVLKKALAKEPSQRYKTVAVMLDDLEKVSVVDTFLRTSPGVPHDLYTQLFNTLCECAPIENNRDLRAIFVDARLRPWRDILPETDNLESRVRSIIDSLHNQQDSEGQNVLALLLSTIAEHKDINDDCYQRLIGLARDMNAT